MLTKTRLMTAGAIVIAIATTGVGSALAASAQSQTKSETAVELSAQAELDLSHARHHADQLVSMGSSMSNRVRARAHRLAHKASAELLSASTGMEAAARADASIVAPTLGSFVTQSTLVAGHIKASAEGGTKVGAILKRVDLAVDHQRATARAVATAVVAGSKHAVGTVGAVSGSTSATVGSSNLTSGTGGAVSGSTSATVGSSNLTSGTGGAVSGSNTSASGISQTDATVGSGGATITAKASAVAGTR